MDSWKYRYDEKNIHNYNILIGCFSFSFDSWIKLKVLINLIQNTYVCLLGGNKYCEPISNLKTIAKMKMHFFIS